MKKLFSILLALSLILLAVGCSQSGKEGAVLPPARTGTGTMSMSLAVDYNFETAFEDVDAVARVKIGNWLGEDTELFSTFYEATVLECFKGEIPEKFTLLQEGCSAVTQYLYPLFTAGNELLLFLNEATDEYEYDSVYWIGGAHTTTVDVSYDEEGNRYYMDRLGMLCQDMPDYCRNYVASKTEAEEIYAYLFEVDPFMETVNFRYPYIYAEKDLEAYMKDLKK